MTRSNPTSLLALALLAGALAPLTVAAPGEPSAPAPMPLAPAPARPLASSHGGVRLEAFYEAVELGELRVDPRFGPDVDIDDVRRRRGGVRVTFGGDELAGYVTAFGESFDNDFLRVDFGSFGLGGGVTGRPVVQRLRRGGKLILPYRVGVSFVGGYEDAGPIDYFQYYGEFEGEFGVGVDYSGFQPSVGLYFSSLSGAVETENAVSGFTDEFYGFNGGLYGELRYQSRRSPVYGGLRGIAGDVQGLTATLGVSF